MRVEQKADINDVGNSSPTSSIPCSGNSPFIDPNSSIGPAGAPPEVKSFLTWVYEGFCSILSAIWNLFFPPVEPPPRSRDGSDGHLSSLSDSPPPTPPGASSDADGPLVERHYKLKGDTDQNSDHRSNGSGSNPGSNVSSVVLVNRPSDEGSGSHISDVSSGELRSSDPNSLGSNPITLSSDPHSTDSDRVTDDANYLLARSNTPHILEASSTSELALIASYIDVIPSPLNISIQNQKDIREVLSTIGSNTALQLGWNSLPSLMKTAPSKPDMISHLKALGAKIDKEVHPYRFLLEIFLDKDSKTSITTLYNGRNDLLTGRNLMWTEFVTNLGKSFDKRKEDIAPHTQFFAQALRIRSSKVDHFSRKINEFVQAKNWNGLLEYLITHVKTPAL